MTDTPTLTIEGKIFVVIPKDEYEALNSMLDETAEDAADRAAFEAAKDEESIPVGFVDRMLAGEHPLRVYRDWRGLTGKELAAKAGGINQSYISDIENRKKSGSVDKLKALANVLGVTIDDLV